MVSFSNSDAANVIKKVPNGVWSALDQGAAAGSNFILNLALARWLLPGEYGEFSIAYALVVLAVMGYTAFILEPLLIIYPKKNVNERSQYLSTLFYVQLTTGSIIAFLIMSVCVILNVTISFSFDMGKSVVIFVSTILILNLWFIRRFYHITDKIYVSFLYSLSYFSITIISIFIFKVTGYMDITIGIAVLGGSAAPLLVFFAIQNRIFKDGIFSNKKFVWLSHFEFARWTTVNNSIYWARDNCYYFILPSIAGAAAAGEFRALNNIIMPILHMATAASSTAIPGLIKNIGNKEYFHMVNRYLIFGVIVSVIIWAIIGLFGFKIIDYVYAGRYTDNAYLLWWVATIPISQYVNLFIWTSFLINGNPKIITAALFMTGPLTIITATLAVDYMGLTGAVYCQAVMLFLFSAALGCLHLWSIKKAWSRLEG